MKKAHPLEQIKLQRSDNFGKRVCQPGWYWDHQTPFQDYDIFYVLAGHGTMTLGTETFSLEKSSCLIMRPGDLPKASQQIKSPLTVLYLHFAVVSREDKTLAQFPFPRYTMVRDSFPAEELLYRLMELLESPPELLDFEFDCLLKVFFIHLFRAHRSPQEMNGYSDRQMKKVRQIMACIRENRGRNIDLGQLSQLVNISPQYMSRLFKTCTKSTLKQFIARTRMEQAKLLLVQTPMNITEVSEQLGYSDVYAFSKSFKQAFNLSPSQYLASVRLPKLPDTSE